MIKKILKIKNVGRFEDYTSKGNVELTSFALIFAENSRGKTTLCDILRSLQTGEGGHITGRKRLGTPSEPEVDVLVDSSITRFRSGKWSATYPNTAIFDSTFVHQSVFAGDYVDHEHKRNLYRVIVGEKGVMLAKKVDELDRTIRDAGRDLTSKKAIVEHLVPAGGRLVDFLSLPPDAEIQHKIQAKEKDLETATNTFNRAAEIQAKGVLKPLSLPIFPANFKELLPQTLATISKDAEVTLREHLTQHTVGATSEWISIGLTYTKGDVCPFCGRGTQGLPLVTAFRQVFDASYRAFKGKLASLESELSSQFNADALLPLQKVVSDNATLLEFWKQFGPLEFPPFTIDDDAREAFTKLKTLAQELLHRKTAGPLEAIVAPAEFETALARYEALSGTATAYNDAVTKVNQRITELKGQSASTDRAKLKKELEALKLVQKRHEPDVMRACKDCLEAEVIKATLERHKDEAKDQLDKYCDNVLKKCEGRINELLDIFGAGFRVANTKQSYSGGRTSSSYQLLINGLPVELGDATTPIHAACFRNTLSAGDKSTLALVFFIIQAELDPKLADKTLVFDDPFTSQDRSRRACTQQHLRLLAKRAKQVIVLSHDPSFLRGVWDDSPKNNLRTLQLTRMGSGTTTLLCEWDIEEATRGDYPSGHRALWNYLHHGEGNPRSVAQNIRPLLEQYLRLKLPHAFADKEWLGDFIKKIREADASSPLAEAQVILTELEAINDYSKRYHHSTNAAAESEPLDDGELQAFGKRTLKLVGGF